MGFASVNFGFSGNGGGGGSGTIDWLLNGNVVGSEKTFGTIDNFDIPFITDDIERMWLKKTGELQIGINPDSPIAILDVAGTVPALPANVFIPIGSEPVFTAYRPLSNTIYVTDFGEQNIYIIDCATNTVIAPSPINAPSGRVYGIAYNSINDTIYFTNYDTADVTVIDCVTNTISVPSIPVGTNPAFICFDPINNRMYTANNGSANVTAIDCNTDTPIATIPVGNNPQFVTYNSVDQRMYVSNTTDNTVQSIPTITNIANAPISVGTTPFGLAYDPLTDFMYVINSGSKNIYAINCSTDTVVGSPVTIGGSGPANAIFNTDDNRVYITDGGNNQLITFDPFSNTIISSVATGGINIYGLALDTVDNILYIADLGGNQIIAFYVASTVNTTINARGLNDLSDTFALKTSNFSGDPIFNVRDDGRIIYTDGNQLLRKLLISDDNGVGTWGDINLANAIFVSKDAYATAANSGKINDPYSTIALAEAAATSGKTIIVFPGTYNETNLGKDGVIYYFLPGVILTSSTNVFSDNGSVITVTILGSAVIDTPRVFIEQQVASTFYVRIRSARCLILVVHQVLAPKTSGGNLDFVAELDCIASVDSGVGQGQVFRISNNNPAVGAVQNVYLSARNMTASQNLIGTYHANATSNIVIRTNTLSTDGNSPGGFPTECSVIKFSTTGVFTRLTIYANIVKNATGSSSSAVFSVTNPAAPATINNAIIVYGNITVLDGAPTISASPIGLTVYGNLFNTSSCFSGAPSKDISVLVYGDVNGNTTAVNNVPTIDLSATAASIVQISGLIKNSSSGGVSYGWRKNGTTEYKAKLLQPSRIVTQSTLASLIASSSAVKFDVYPGVAANNAVDLTVTQQISIVVEDANVS